MEQIIRNELMGSCGNATFQKNHLIEAGAGAGKTFTLVHRIAHQLTNELCKPENMAVITFTNKATEEMRNELNELLEKQRDAASDPGEKQRLDELLRAAGRMQVSTIHSFCKVMLESMPFESGLGMETTYLENENSACSEFFMRQYRQDPSKFADMEAIGINYRQLTKSFVELCNITDGTIPYIPKTDTETQNRKNKLIPLMQQLHKDLPSKLQGFPQALDLLDENIRALLSLSEQDFAADDNNSLQLATLVSVRKHPLKQYGSNAFLLSVRPNAGSATDGQKAQWKQVKTIWEKAKKEVGNTAKELVHSYCMPIMLQLLNEYHQEKRAKHLISSNDLLVLTRNMLRDSPNARRALHDRFRVLYVDEFQDTDPIQAQILFYLTTDEQNFDKDWRKCRPVPGSLFLVGDPKQAIYRFRGADIDVYKDVENLFRNNGIGDIVHLEFNYRSAKEICDLVAQIFTPDAAAPVPGETDEVSPVLDGGYYQAKYTDMTSHKGSLPLARTFYYEPLQATQQNTAPNADQKKKNDALRIAAFIKKMYSDQVPVGRSSHPAQYSDFLILPPKKEDVTLYAQALIDANIPVNATGQQYLNEIEPIHRLLIHLASLSAPGNDLALGRVLVLCYGIKLPTIRRFMQQAQITSMTSALYPEKIEALGNAFSSAANRDEEIISLCAVLKELSELRHMVQTEPAMTVIERLTDGGYSIWTACSSKEQRQREYAYVQQFLQLLRRSPEHEFSALAAYAAECGSRYIEHELTLTDNTGAVRIMNVHKSKGLQGEIVILPYANRGNKHTVTHHAKRTGAGTHHECCLYFPNGRQTTVCGQPPLWDTAPQGGISSTAREISYLEAERVRLLYVAATRAASMLLVCDDATDTNGYWKSIARRCAQLDTADKDYGDQFKCLDSKIPLPNSSTQSASQTNSTSSPVDTYAIENNLEQLAQDLLGCKQYPITPSKLDSASRTAVTRKDREDQVVSPSDSSADLTDTTKDTAPAASTFTPHGPDWGTIVHRIMELAVRSGCFDTNSVESFARQAVTETLPDELLSKQQKTMLFEHADDLPNDWVDNLSQAAAKASAFLTDPNAPLRKLLDGATCYPELPFILRETNRNSPLYRHLSAHIKNPLADNMELDVQGVIDLAIWKNGEWTVVDYKTDRVKNGEEEAAFSARLRKEYTAQIASYAQVLERLGKGHTTRACLCSIPLGGKLIELDLDPPSGYDQNADDTNNSHATQPASPDRSTVVPPAVPSAQAANTPVQNPVAQTPPAAQSATPAATVDKQTVYAARHLYANNHFHPVLSNASGTFDFTLLVNGTPVVFIDKKKNRVTEFHQCRSFVKAVQCWLEKQCPNQDCSINLYKAGNQVLLHRMLKVMYTVLPEPVWNAVEFKWKNPDN